MRPLVVLNSILITMILGMGSCANEPECDVDIPHQEISVAFYDIEELTIKSVKFEVQGIGSETVLYDNDVEQNKFNLLLNPGADSVAYSFKRGVSTDTLVLKYRRSLKWLSEDCGPNIKYDELEIDFQSSVFNSFDSLGLVNDQVDIMIDENIRVYN